MKCKNITFVASLSMLSLSIAVLGCKKSSIIEEEKNISKIDTSKVISQAPIPDYLPITSRLFVQRDTAKASDVVDGQWVAIGNANTWAIQKDNVIKFNGQPSYRFELKQGTEGVSDRAELQYVYTRGADYAGVSSADYVKDQTVFRVDERGKGITPQGTKWRYKFSIYVPTDLPADASAIFAQIHGMSNRTLVSDPNGVETAMTNDQFIALGQTMTFKSNIGYNKATPTVPNGWMLDEGGYPPMEMGFKSGYFYISATSDRKWVSFNTERNGANPSDPNVVVLQPKYSTVGFKSATLAYKEPITNYPKGIWVSYQMDIDFSTYGGRGNQMLTTGKMDVLMSYTQNGSAVERHLVNNAPIQIGRNDEFGYFFKFGIYRPGGTAQVVFNCAGYSQTQR